MPLLTQFLIATLLLASVSATLLVGPAYGSVLCGVAWLVWSSTQEDI